MNYIIFNVFFSARAASAALMRPRILPAMSMNRMDAVLLDSAIVVGSDTYG